MTRANLMSHQPTEAGQNPAPDDSINAPTKPRRAIALDWGPPWIGPIYHRAQIDLLWLLVAIVLTANGIVFLVGVDCWQRASRP